ncbi:MAG: hypothetical protein LBV67_06220 [Streptococcaceae bacterium]|jgi:hypothetical protein|nr:hypothetical protein [Streptococcaceae bacterium]
MSEKVEMIKIEMPQEQWEKMMKAQEIVLRQINIVAVTGLDCIVYFSDAQIEFIAEAFM